MSNSLKLTAVLIATILTTSILAEAADKKDKGKKRKPDVRLKVGTVAPDFAIYRLDDAIKMDKAVLDAPADAPKKSGVKTPEKIKLSGFRGKKPVFLIFSSYT